jgi:hypothetical protein
MVLRARPTVEHDNLLSMLVLRHGVLPVGIVLAGAACEPFTGASATSDASASCYGFSKNTRILSVVMSELKTQPNRAANTSC